MATNNVQADLAGVYVRATKKGNAPVAVEKRPKGKVVTLISNIEPADAGPKQLLSFLKHRLGCGGIVAAGGGVVELQGSHEEAAVQLLTANNLLKGMAGTGKRAEKKEEVQVPIFKREDWNCYNCNTQNQGERSTCSKCSSFRKWSEQQRELDAMGVVRQAVVIGAPVRKRGPHWCPLDWHYCSGFCNTDTNDNERGEACWSNWEDSLCEQAEVIESTETRRGVKRTADEATSEATFEALMTLGMIACKFSGEYDRTQKKPKTQKAKKIEEEKKVASTPKAATVKPPNPWEKFKNYVPPQGAALENIGRPRPVFKKSGGSGGGGGGSDKGTNGAGRGGGGRAFRFGNAHYETDDDHYHDEEYYEDDYYEDGEWPEQTEALEEGWTADSITQPEPLEGDVFEGYDAEEQAMIAAALGLSKGDSQEKTMLKMALRMSLAQHQHESEFRAAVGEVSRGVGELSLPETKQATVSAKPQEEFAGFVPLPSKPRANNNPTTVSNGRVPASSAGRAPWTGVPTEEEFPTLGGNKPPKARPLVTQHAQPEFPALPTASRRRGSREEVKHQHSSAAFPSLPTKPSNKSPSFPPLSTASKQSPSFPPLSSSSKAMSSIALPPANKQQANGHHQQQHRPHQLPHHNPLAAPMTAASVVKNSQKSHAEKQEDADLERAMQLSLEEERRQSKKSNNNKQHQQHEEKQTTGVCPVCNKHVPLAQLNTTHVDECLNLQYLQNNPSPAPTVIHTQRPR